MVDRSAGFVRLHVFEEVDFNHFFFTLLNHPCYFQSELETKHSRIIEEVKRSIQSQYEQFQTQHEEYSTHIKEELAKKKADLEQQKQLVVSPFLLRMS